MLKWPPEFVKTGKHWKTWILVKLDLEFNHAWRRT